MIDRLQRIAGRVDVVGRAEILPVGAKHLLPFIDGNSLTDQHDMIGVGRRQRRRFSMVTLGMAASAFALLSNQVVKTTISPLTTIPMTTAKTRPKMPAAMAPREALAGMLRGCASVRATRPGSRLRLLPTPKSGTRKGKQIGDAADHQRPEQPLPAPKGAGEGRLRKVEDGQTEDKVDPEYQANQLTNFAP